LKRANLRAATLDWLVRATTCPWRCRNWLGHISSQACATTRVSQSAAIATPSIRARAATQLPGRHKVGSHSEEVGHKLLRPIRCDKGSSEFGLVTCNMPLQLRDLRLQHSYLRLESGGSGAGGAAWFFQPSSIAIPLNSGRCLEPIIMRARLAIRFVGALLISF
jgi:hypothetical protein